MTSRPAVRTAREVSEALADGRPVVALETAVLTHGIPRDPISLPGSLEPGHAAAKAVDNSADIRHTLEAGGKSRGAGFREAAVGGGRNRRHSRGRNRQARAAAEKGR